MSKPKCSVGGLIPNTPSRHAVMCSHVIVGLEYCGRGGACPYKVMSPLAPRSDDVLQNQEKPNMTHAVM